MVVTDEDVVRRLGDVPPRSGPLKPLNYSFRILGFGAGQVELELHQFGTSARVLVPLPSSGRPLPWLWLTAPQEADGWVQEFLEWLDEEMFSGGLGPHFARETTEGVDRLVVEGYGFRRSDSREHERLLDAAGAGGSWRGGGLAHVLRRMLGRRPTTSRRCL